MFVMLFGSSHLIILSVLDVPNPVNVLVLREIVVHTCALLRQQVVDHT